MNRFGSRNDSWSVAHTIINIVLTFSSQSDGKARPSLATTELEVLADGKDTYFDETIVKNVSAISYAGK